MKKSSKIEKNNKKETNYSDFVLYSKKGKEAYDSETLNIRNGIKGGTINSKTLSSSTLSRDLLKRNSLDSGTYATVTGELLRTNPLFGSVISYLQTQSDYRYLVTPIRKHTKDGSEDKNIKNKQNKEEYIKAYKSMLSIVDGISIQTVFPDIVGIILTEGVIYLYGNVHKKTETFETVVLPKEYCRIGERTTFGTNGIDFNFEYFSKLERNLNSNASKGVVITLEEVLDSLPKEFGIKYNEYLNDKQKWKSLDSRFAVSIALNKEGVTPYANLAGPLADYENLKVNEVKKSDKELTNILVHQIPNYEGELVLDVDEAIAIHDSMSRAFENQTGFKLLTTFGPTQLLNIDQAMNNTGKRQDAAYNDVYNIAGLNRNIFMGTSADAIVAALAKDEAFVNLIINKITLFYNLSLNNLCKFGDYELKLEIIPINRYNYNSRIKAFKESATLGIGKLQYIVASGIKQSAIESTIELESILQLDRLKPLQSSHTQSNGRPQGSKTDDEKVSIEKQENTGIEKED